MSTEEHVVIQEDTDTKEVPELPDQVQEQENAIARRDGVISQLRHEIQHYKEELSMTQAYEQRVSRELIDYLLMERDAVRNAMQQQ